MTNEADKIRCFSRELQELRRRFSRDFEMHPAAMVGCLHMEVTLIEMGAIREREQLQGKPL